MDTEGYTLIRAIAGDERLVIVSEELFDRLMDAAERHLFPDGLEGWVNSSQNRNELPITLAQRLTRGETPHRVYREYRGFTTDRLAETTGLPHDYILALERGEMEETLDARRRIADALDVRLDDLERH
ncbi:MAG: helix-turn-helix transcriptional regulator [Sphingomonadales bacterium]